MQRDALPIPDAVIARRTFLQIAAGAAASPLLSTTASPLFSTQAAAQAAYPVRSVRVLVGFASGGSVDIVARLTSQWLSERLGQQFYVENRPGAGTNLATEAVAKAPPDGYTLLLVTAANFINATLYEKLNFNFIRDIAPVAGLSVEPNVMVVHPSTAARTVPEFIALARANPGKIMMASGGNGAPSHVSGELFKMLTGVNLVHVPYRGANPALTDLLGGQVQVYFTPMSAAVEYIRSGKLRALAVTSTARAPVLADVPTIAEFVPDYEASQWYGLGAPRDTPPEIIGKLNREINAILTDPANRARLAELGETPLVVSPAGFQKLIGEETQKWGKVVKFSGARAD